MNLEKSPDPRGPSAWYALLVRPRHEWQAAQALERKQLDVFLPKYRVRRRWSDREKEYDAPLFPRYLFCRFSRSQRRTVLETPSVQQVVGFGGTPHPVDERELLALRSAARSGSRMTPHPWIQAGRRVRILEGPLAGLEGILTSMRGDDRMILSVSLLRRSVAVEIDRGWAARLQPLRAAAGA